MKNFASYCLFNNNAKINVQEEATTENDLSETELFSLNLFQEQACFLKKKDNKLHN